MCGACPSVLGAPLVEMNPLCLAPWWGHEGVPPRFPGPPALPGEAWRGRLFAWPHPLAYIYGVTTQLSRQLTACMGLDSRRQAVGDTGQEVCPAGSKCYVLGRQRLCGQSHCRLAWGPWGACHCPRPCPLHPTVESGMAPGVCTLLLSLGEPWGWQAGWGAGSPLPL